MEWLQRMCKALDYIEDHMEDEFHIDKIAGEAYSSTFHFQRMFYMLTGVTVAEYVRRRRLTLAAQMLASSDAKVIDVSLKYGYDTPESFSKAFRKVHGISPSAAREPGAKLKAYPRLSFQISLKGDKDMNYRVVEKKAFKVIGKEIRVTTENGENFKRIPQFWKECHEDGTCDKLGGLAGELGILGICMNDYDEEMKEFTYVVAVENPGESVPEGFVEKEIPAYTWAIFESVGVLPEAIQTVWKRIFSEWFPSTGYQHAKGPELEVYPEGDNDENYRCEVWVPVVKG